HMKDTVCLELGQGRGSDRAAFSAPAVVYSPAVSDEQMIASRTERANACHQAVSDAESQSLTSAIACGEHLTEAKRLVGHGRWQAYVASHCRFSAQMARRYMAVYEHSDAIHEEMRANPGSIACFSDAVRFVREIIKAEKEAEAKTKPGFFFKHTATTE